MEKYFDSMSDWNMFLFQTQGFWTMLFWLLLVVRLILNWLIYDLIDSGLVHPNIPKWRTIVPQSYEEIERLKRTYPKLKNPTIDGGDDYRGFELLAIAIFTLWWGKDLGDTPKSVRLKKVANILNLIFIPFFIGVVILFFHLQEANMILEHVKKDWFYFLQ